MHRLASRRRSLLTLISGAYLATMVALWLAETLVAERHWLTTLATYAPQQIYGLPLPFLVLASLIRRNRRALALNLAALLILVFGLMGFTLPLRLPSRSQGTSLRVMTYNIHHGAAGIAAVARVIRDHRPDIVCLQEANACEPWEDPMPELVRLLPGWRATSHPRELAVLSHYPIVGERFAQVRGSSERGVLQVTVLAKGIPLRILDAHFSTAMKPESLSRRKTSVRRYLRGAAVVRSRQAARLKGLAATSEGPVVIAGDLNTPPRGRVYRRLARSYTDAFRAAGVGFGHTYRANLPVERIDYVFVGNGVKVKRCFTPRVRASDHRPVVADLMLEN
jgi:vancomycin resistance protein VanJ